jgi:hypothetical protein
VAGEGINGGRYYTAPYDKTHSLSVLCVYTVISKWTLGATFTLASGLSATFPALSAAPIDTLYFSARSTGNAGPKDGLRATITLRDPLGIKNDYLWDQIVDGQRVVLSDSGRRGRLVRSDDLLDGRRIRDFQPYDGVVVKSGQVVQVRQVALSEQVYRYYIALSEQEATSARRLTSR